MLTLKRQRLRTTSLLSGLDIEGKDEPFHERSDGHRRRVGCLRDLDHQPHEILIGVAPTVRRVPPLSRLVLAEVVEQVRLGRELPEFYLEVIRLEVELGIDADDQLAHVLEPLLDHRRKNCEDERRMS